MMRRLTAVGVGLGAWLLASAAGAQEHHPLGQRGQFIISADRLVSFFSFSHLSQDALANGNQSVTTNETSFSLLWGSPPAQVTADGVPFVNPFAVPRVGVDYVVAPHVTVGGDLVIFFTVGGSTGVDNRGNGTTTTTSSDNPGQFVFGLAPRGGYILPLTDMFSLWLRGGFSYYLETSKVTTTAGQTTSVSLNQLALDLDPQFVVTVIPHVAFTAGLTLDIPLTGGHASDVTMNGATSSQSASSSIVFFGLTVGMAVYF